MAQKSTGLLPVRAGVAFGILWALWVLLLGIFASFGYAKAWVDLLASGYVGYSATASGILIGIIYAFIDGFISAFLIIWIYNRLNINK